MIQLDYLEAKIIECCNYRCSACAGWGNIAEREEYDIQQFEKDIKRIHEIFDKVKMFHILGGEPLLNSRVCDYIRIARTYLQDTEIYLITNGTLIHRMPAEFFACIRENNIKVHISHYPVEKDMKKIEQACELLEKEKARYEIIDTQLFSVSMQLEDNTYDVKETFQACTSFMNCTNLYNGMIYKCPRPISLRHYDKKFGTSYSDMLDGIDLYAKGITGEKILEELEKPIRTCRLCTPERKYLKWSQCDVDQYQWQISNENKLLLEQNEEELLEVVKNQRLMIFNIDHEKKNIQMEECVIEELAELIKQDFYIWFQDLRCLSYCHVLKYLAEKNGTKISGVIPKNKKIANALWGFPILEKEQIKHITRIAVLASGVKGRFEVEYEIKNMIGGR